MKRFILILVILLSLQSLVYGSGGVGGGSSGTVTDDNINIGNGAISESKAVPNCTDSAGNHLNYTASSNTLSCGTTSTGSGGTAGAPPFTQTATVTITATSETTMLGSGTGSLTLPANWFTSAGNSLIIDSYGRLTTQAVPGTQRVRLKFGASVILDTTAYNLVGSITDAVWRLHTVITARTVGASGTVIAESIFETTGAALVPNEQKMLNTATITIDTTATQVVDLTNLFNTASNSISTETFTMYGPGSSVSSVFGRTGAVVAANGDYNSTTDTYTNKTIDAEGTGNVITIPFKPNFPAAGCNNATPSAFWDLPTTTPAVAACVTGTNTQKGVLDFADTTGGFSAQNWTLLPSDFTGTIDAKIIWLTTAVTGNVKWSLSTICTATDGTETDDAAFNTASTVTTAAPGTASRLQTSSITSLTITGCAVGEILHLKLFRDGNDAADTIAATARFYDLELTIRRAI